MKYIFIVQGEGMGHTTQSLALRSLLEKHGHTVTNTFLGRNFFRPKNELYNQHIHEYFYSPVFIGRADKTGINLSLTFLYNLLLTPLYIFTILCLAYRIKINKADAVIVFYDMIGQLGSFFAFTDKQVFSVSHHFFFGHPAFKWPSNRKTEQIMLRFHSYLASVGARKKLALSFTMENNIPGKNLYIVPPLLRKDILDSIPASDDHIHMYCLHPGFLVSVAELANKFPHREFSVFLHEFMNEISIPLNVHVHLISEQIFRESIRTSAMVICTAGFETLAESIFLNKPLIIVPSKGHFEQYCNTIDALRAGSVIVEKSFNIPKLPDSVENPAHGEFIKWIAESEDILLKYITE